ncbi:hypothetical protein TSUD_102720 [Trifolium subterraneum]|uniref:Uncharacterized protein n=1 Tax=Trifolium subterraneum TaxID=3900 RepID=A0A2Z6N1D0_TRISU|nr:hypothetical protein TSUD_102720 [Trifolium subterraneum]
MNFIIGNVSGSSPVIATYICLGWNRYGIIIISIRSSIGFDLQLHVCSASVSDSDSDFDSSSSSDSGSDSESSSGSGSDSDSSSCSDSDSDSNSSSDSVRTQSSEEEESINPIIHQGIRGPQQPLLVYSRRKGNRVHND